LVDEIKIRKYVQDLFNPKPKDPSAVTSPEPTKTNLANLANLANGKAVDGGKIPCVN